MRIGVDPEAELEDPALTLRKLGKSLAHRAGAQGVLGQLLRTARSLVSEEISELASVLVADG